MKHPINRWRILAAQALDAATDAATKQHHPDFAIHLLCQYLARAYELGREENAAEGKETP